MRANACVCAWVGGWRGVSLGLNSSSAEAQAGADGETGVPRAEAFRRCAGGETVVRRRVNPA